MAEAGGAEAGFTCPRSSRRGRSRPPGVHGGAAARALATNRRTLRGSFRPGDAGPLDAGGDVDAPRVRRPRWRRPRCRASRPPARSTLSPAGTTVGQGPSPRSRHCPGWAPSTSTTSTPKSSARARAGSWAEKALITSGTRARDLAGGLRRLPAVELGAPQAGLGDDLHDPLGGLVAEDPDGQDVGRQPLGDVAGDRGGDLAGRARDEVEADGVGVHGDREQGVLLAGDAADLDEHAGDRTGHPPPTPAPVAVVL